jgi:signal transduction histidine kinase
MAHRRYPVFLTVVLSLIQVLGCLLASRGETTGAPLDELGFGLLIVGPAVLILRRARPLITLLVALTVTYGYVVLGYPRGPFFLAGLVALFGAVRRAKRPAVWGITGGVYLAFVAATIANLSVAGRSLGDVSLATYVVTAVWTAFALAVAEATHAQSERFAEGARARAEAARARQEQARRQASDERLRIAKELHDVLGHHLSLINVRAGVALHLLDTQPEQAREALGAIKVASAEALREVRTVLATLKPADEAPPLAPAPGLAALDELGAAAVAAGTSVHIVRTGGVRSLPGEVERAAYRIVQESLTNVRRHAGSEASVTVSLEYGPDGLTVRVEDTGVGGDPSRSDGNGIPGMRERAAALGGTLNAGPGPDGDGFRVEAYLPVAPTNVEESA